MTRAGCPTGKGITIRVYEVTADGQRRDVVPQQQSYGSWPTLAREAKRQAPTGG